MKKITASILAFTLTVTLLSGAFRSNTAKAALTHTLGNPVITDGVSTWDCVWFGNYYQEDINGKKKDPIKWRVLSVKGQDVFLMSDQILDWQCYNDWLPHDTRRENCKKSWADSDIRNWLNKTFIKAAFTAGEQKAITTTKVKTSSNPTYGIDGGRDTRDKIYLPSFEEVSNAAYGFPVDYSTKSEARKAKNTTYKAQEMCIYWNSWHSGNDKRMPEDFLVYDNWWLRNPAREKDKMFINLNGKDGAEGRGGTADSEHGVRPVLHLDLSKADTLTYAGRINSKGEVTEPSLIQTEQPLPQQPVRKENKQKVVQLANVKITSLKNKKTKSVSVKWKKITGAGGYQLQYSTNSKFKGKKTKNTKSITCLCKKLKKNRKYYFRIRACRIVDKRKIYGCWSKTKKITVKK